MKRQVNLLLFSIISLSIASCKRQYAFVQPAQQDDFVLRTKKVDNKKFEIENSVEDKVERKSETTSPALEIVTMVPQVPQSEYTLESAVVERRTTIKSINQFAGNSFEESDLQSIEKQVSKQPTKKKKKSSFKRLNSMIPTGFILLGVAILLALVNLNGLALLFGVASILFLYLGFKRFFRKKNRRQIFK